MNIIKEVWNDGLVGWGIRKGDQSFHTGWAAGMLLIPPLLLILLLTHIFG